MITIAQQTWTETFQVSMLAAETMLNVAAQQGSQSSLENALAAGGAVQSVTALADINHCFLESSAGPDNIEWLADYNQRWIAATPFSRRHQLLGETLRRHAEKPASLNEQQFHLWQIDWLMQAGALPSAAEGVDKVVGSMAADESNAPLLAKLLGGEDGPEFFQSTVYSCSGIAAFDGLLRVAVGDKAEKTLGIQRYAPSMTAILVRAQEHFSSTVHLYLASRMLLCGVEPEASGLEIMTRGRFRTAGGALTEDKYSFAGALASSLTLDRLDQNSVNDLFARVAKLGVDLDARNSMTHGYSPLQAAVVNGRIRNAIALLHCGADPRLGPASGGETPIEMMQKRVAVSLDKQNFAFQTEQQQDLLARMQAAAARLAAGSALAEWLPKNRAAP